MVELAETGDQRDLRPMTFRIGGTTLVAARPGVVVFRAGPVFAIGCVGLLVGDQAGSIAFSLLGIAVLGVSVFIGLRSLAIIGKKSVRAGAGLKGFESAAVDAVELGNGPLGVGRIEAISGSRRLLLLYSAPFMLDGQGEHQRKMARCVAAIETAISRQAD